MKRILHPVYLAALTLMISACGPSLYESSYVERSNEWLNNFQNYPPQETVHGKVTYYSDALAGNHTANGEIYDPRILTAAHRTLHFGTVVRVTREQDGRSVIVRINDRGPFGDKSRILDLSRAAAERLGMIHAGVVPARVEVLWQEK